MKATLKNYRQAPRKVRLITSLIQGKNAQTALYQLNALIKRGALPVKKLLEKAINNSGMSAEQLTVKSATVDKGVVLKRSMPRAFGRAFPIHKHNSHINIILEAKK